MRPPRIAPPFPTGDPAELERLWAALPLVTEPSASGKYLHWDDLQHRTPPAGLTREAWWFALKFRRESGRRKLKLVDKAGKPFTIQGIDAMLEKLHRVDLEGGGKIGLDGDSLNERDRDVYIYRSLVDEAIASSQIEGAGTTSEVAKEMLRTGRAPRSHGEKMILNNYQTIQYLRTVKGERLTPELLCRLQYMVTEGTLDNPEYCGRFREHDVHVTDADQSYFFFPPQASELAKRVELLCQFANGEDEGGYFHPVIRSILLHYWLAYDHPFADGNGRTARALFYWSMLHHRYWLFEFVSISRLIYRSSSKYYRAFRLTESDDNDLNYFVLYHLEVIDNALDELHTYIERRSVELHDVTTLLKQSVTLNHRQRDLLAHALKKSSAIFTIEAHKNTHQTAYATARQDLLHLADLGYLVVQKAGKKMEFIPAPRLREKVIGTSRHHPPK